MQDHLVKNRTRFFISALLILGATIPHAPPGWCYLKVISNLDRPAFQHDYMACDEWEAGKKREAMKNLDESLKLDPKDFTVWEHRAMANFSLGRYERARKDFEQASKVVKGLEDAGELRKGGNYQSHIKEWQALILLKQGKTRKALGWLNETVAVWPDFARSYYERGVALQTNREFDKAIHDYDQALDLESKQEHRNLELKSYSLYNKAICLKKIGHTAEAKSVLQSASKFLDLNDRREMFGAPAQPIFLQAMVSQITVDTKDER